MVFKELEIQGFKSFPDKVKITFDEGVTGVVGPNGSGKSNLSDAVRWVLGETSARQLRAAGKMEDVIFGGTRRRGAMGFAQVRLTLDNSSHALDVEADEVTIGRRYYRSGESEYSINGQICRLKDVYELLLDTGIGRDGYSVIGQGRIAEIVAAKSSERREIFEEACGIAKYRYRKNEAERRLAAAALAAVLGFGACFVWPPIQKAIAAVTGFIAASGNIGLFLYGFLERLLIPTGLHHLVYMPFQFSQLGGQLMVGSVTYTGAYVVMMTEYYLGLRFSDGIVWMYTGFTKTFGYLGIAAAFIFTTRKENRARTAAAMIPLAVTASVASITEPIDFLFCFVSPLLWVAHAVITGGFMVLLQVLHVRAFTSNLLGSLVFNLSAGEQLQNMPLLYLLGFAEILTYFAVFSVLIKAKDLPTPGREATLSADQSPYADPQEVCRFIAALGGPENIAQLGNCFTRLRLTVRDASLLDMGALLSLPHKGLVVQGTRVQLVCGLHAAQLRHALEQQLAEMAPV